MAAPMDTIKGFLQGWRPFAELEGHPVGKQGVLAVLGANGVENRREQLTKYCDLYRLHGVYRELKMLRDGRNEKAERFEALATLSAAELAEAIGAGTQKDLMGLIQFCFEFGRHEVPSKHHIMREFLLTLFRLKVGDPDMKYTFFGGGVLYTDGGKTHDEMVRDFARLGLGGGQPLAGGVISRKDTLSYTLDISSTAYRGTNDPKLVREALLRWVRTTGGDPDKLIVKTVTR